MSKNWTVYMHTTPSGKRYIGITSQGVKDRWKNGYGYEEGYFRNAILKYGWSNIQHEILFSGLSEEEAKAKETELIAEYKTMDRDYGYNRTAGGDGCAGLIHSEESKLKMSIAQKGKKHSEKSRRKISESNKGRIVSEETRRKIGLAHKGNTHFLGKTHSEETIQKMREAAIGQRHSEETRRKLSEYSKGNTNRRGKAASEETRRKLRESHMGKSPTAETRRKMSEAHKGNTYALGYRHSEEAKRKIGEACGGASSPCAKAVRQLDRMTREIIAVYPFMAGASTQTGIGKTSISNCCVGLSKTAGGYIWEYVE